MKVTKIALATALTLTSTLALAQIRGTRIWISRGSFGGFVRRYGEFGCAAASATLAAAPQFTALFVRAYSANRRANAAPTSDWRGGSAPARPHVKAAQVEANDSARRSSSAVSCASGPILIRPMARKANNSAA